MYKSGRTLAKPLSEDILTKLYDATYAAIKQCAEEGLCSMPPTRTAARTGARGTQLTSSERIHRMSAESAVPFGNCLLQNIRDATDNHPNYREMFFFHTLRNLKNETRHPLPFVDDHSHLKVISLVEKFLDTGDPTLNLDVDIGVEIHASGMTILPDRACLAQLIEILVGAEVGGEAFQRARRTGKLQIIGCAYEASGITITIVASEPNHIFRICIYSTEKHPTYGPHRGHNSLHVHPNYIAWTITDKKKKIDFFEKLRIVFSEFAKSVDGSHHSFPLRMEVRLPFEHCENALQDFDINRLDTMLFELSSFDWMYVLFPSYVSFLITFPGLTRPTMPLLLDT